MQLLQKVKTAAVYRIRNKKTGKSYVGSALCCKKRWYYHRFLLRHNRHHSHRLQKSFNKHGESVFVFSVLEQCKPEQRLRREKYWIRFYGTFLTGYNCVEDPTIPVLSPEALVRRGKAIGVAIARTDAKTLKKRHRQRARSQPVEEHRQRSLAMWRNPRMRAKITKKIRKAIAGKPRTLSEETRRKMSFAAKRRAKTAEGRAHLQRATKLSLPFLKKRS